MVIFGTFGTPVAFCTLMIASVFSTLGIIPSVFWYIWCTLVHLTFGTAVGTLHPVWKNKHLSYWNFSSGCYFDYSNRRAIPHQATKFRTCCRVMTSYTISRWRQWWLNTTSGFVFDDVTLFRRSKSICKPNLIDISKSVVEI